MTGVTSALTIPEWIVVLAVPSVVIGIFGYRWIHRVMQATAVVVGVVAGHHARPGAAARRAARQRDHAGPPARRAVRGRGRAAGHRHAVVRPVRLATTPGTCPRETNGRRLFWAIYAGNVLATIFSCAVGAYLAALLPDARPGRAPSARSPASGR